MEIIEFANQYLGEYRTKGKELQIRVCPFCGKDKWKFYLNSETGLFHCKSGSCDERGSFHKLLHKYGIETNFRESAKYKTYDKVLSLTVEEQKEFKSLNDKMYEYWKSRKISKNTLDYMKVCQRKGVIVFPYMYQNQLKMLKYRINENGTQKKKIWQQEGGISTLWGLDKVNTEEPVIITEGEPDMLSWIEAGISNVVSLPFGTSNMDWIENDWEILQKIQMFYICMDNDDAGKKAEAELKSRLGIDKCKRIDLGNYNDVNDILKHEGPDKLQELYELPIDYPIDGLYYAEDINLNGKYDNFVTSLREIDKKVGGFKLGNTTVWTGTPGSGKSTLLNQIMIKALDNGYKCCLYTGEMSKEDIMKWFCLQLFGKKSCIPVKNEIRDTYEYRVKEEYIEKFGAVVGKNLLIIETESQITDEELLEKMKFAYRRDGVKVFVIDNLMKVSFSKKGNSSKYDNQADFMSAIVDFSIKNNVHNHLIAHPKKPNGEMTMYDISGASEIPNLAHNIIHIKRLDEKEKDKIWRELGKNFDNLITVTKNRNYGDGVGSIGLQYDKDTKRFYTNDVEKHEEYNIVKNQFGYRDLKKDYKWFDDGDIELGDNDFPFE